MDSHPLLGRWRFTDGSGDAGGIVIEFEFLPGGRMLHAIRSGGGSLLTDLVYRLEEDRIISRQINETTERTTRYALLDDGRLRLEGEDSVTWYVRSPAGES